MPSVIVCVAILSVFICGSVGFIWRHVSIRGFEPIVDTAWMLHNAKESEIKGVKGVERRRKWSINKKVDSMSSLISCFKASPFFFFFCNIQKFLETFFSFFPN